MREYIETFNLKEKIVVSLRINLFYIYYINAGQVPEDLCFAHGECKSSLFLADWYVPRFCKVIARITIFFPRPTPDPQECLELCRGLEGCEYFTHYGEGGGESENLCLGLANCREFSPLSCAECYSGEDACDGIWLRECLFQCLCSRKKVPKIERNGFFCKGCFVFTCGNSRQV